MTINTGFLTVFSILTSAVLALTVPLQPAAAGVAIGQTVSGDSRVDGIRVPSGTTLISPSLVETGAEPAVVHLSSGEVLTLTPLTSAVMVSAEGGVEVAVRAGNVIYTGASGAVEALSETESMVVTATGQIQEGPRTGDKEEKERLCELQDWTEELWQTCRSEDPDDQDCDWDLIRVPMSDVPRYLEVTAVLACEDRNDLDLECDCREGLVVVWWIPPAASAVAGGVVLSQILQDDDEPPASPSTP